MNRNKQSQKSMPFSKSQTYFLILGLALLIVFGAISWNIWQTLHTPELSPQVNGQPTTQVSVQLPAASEVVPISDAGTELGKVAPDFSVPTLDRLV